MTKAQSVPSDQEISDLIAKLNSPTALRDAERGLRKRLDRFFDEHERILQRSREIRR